MSHRRERITVKKKTEEKGVLGKALQQQERETKERFGQCVTDEKNKVLCDRNSTGGKKGLGHTAICFKECS